MKNHIVLATVAALASACSTHPAPDPVVASAARCDAAADTSATARAMLAPRNVISVSRAEEATQVGRASLPTVHVGADLRIAAERGMSPAYVERTLSCHAVSGATFGDADPLHPDSGAVREVTVRNAGGSLVVRISGTGRTASESILARAQRLAPAGSVSVEQVAVGPRSHMRL